MKSLKSSLPLDKDSSLDIWGGNSTVGFGENTTLFCHVSRVLFSAQISHAWGHLLWKREFRMPTWKGKRTLECWNTSDCRYRHWNQEHSQSSSREGTPEILFADVWDIHCPLAQYWHIGLLNWWARVPPSVQGKKKSLLARQPTSINTRFWELGWTSASPHSLPCSPVLWWCPWSWRETVWIQIPHLLPWHQDLEQITSFLSVFLALLIG